jgi:hypothetical protein
MIGKHSLNSGQHFNGIWGWHIVKEAKAIEGQTLMRRSTVFSAHKKFIPKRIFLVNGQQLVMNSWPLLIPMWI